MASPAFRIGPVKVENPVLLAPMEDVTSLAFRLICKRIAHPGLMFTEFVSSMAIHYGAEKTLKKMRIENEERPLGIQIFGGDPEIMAETARVSAEMGADLIDINMGCWVPKVVKTGSGAALLKDPDHAEKIVKAVVEAVDVPVTVKVRAGWDYSLFAAPDLAKRFQGAGAQMITLHARFAKQGFEGEANWQLISDLREAVSVPLIGNGDIKTADDAKRMMSETGCDGVMVGRAAISNPWALARITCGVTGDLAPPEPTLEERIETAIEHAQLTVMAEAEVDHFADVEALPQKEQDAIELRAIRRLRGQLPLYIKGVYGAATVRGRLSRVESLQELSDILWEFESYVRSEQARAPSA
jgi:nifR3 family TIM-barrel protein